MYPSVLQYPFIVGDTFVRMTYDNTGVLQTPLYQWLIYGKLPVAKSVSPTYSTQNITSEGINRYLSNVTISRIPIVVSTATLAASATATYTFDSAYSVTSSDTAVATAIISSGVVTITGVAAGTSVINILDVNSNVIATITITVA